MKNTSLWLSTMKNDSKVNLINHNVICDILIVGGGITGISTAYQLKDSDLNICLVERNKIGHGVTARTTGKLTFLQELIYSKIAKTKTLNAAKYYLNSQLEAINIVKNIVESNNIPCDLKFVDSYVFTNSKDNISKIKKEKDILSNFNIEVEENIKIPYDIKCQYSIKVKNTAVFHPLKYLYSLKNICINSGIKIYENSNLTNIQKEKDYYIAYVNDYIIKAKTIVIATHYSYFFYAFYHDSKVLFRKIIYICLQS